MFPHVPCVLVHHSHSEILFELRERGVYIAAASRTAAPNVARQALRGLMLERTPGAAPVPAHTLFDQLEIYPGSKVSHFRAISDTSGVAFEDMVFFDDEHRNAEVERRLGVHFVELCPGVCGTCKVGLQGLDRSTYERGMAAWRKKRGAADKAAN